MVQTYLNLFDDSSTGGDHLLPNDVQRPVRAAVALIRTHISLVKRGSIRLWLLQ